jgi:hypothetical protein
MSDHPVPSAASRTLGALALLAGTLCCHAAAAQTGWSFSVTPYLWATSMSGEVDVSPLPAASVDASFSDILDNLDFALMAVGEARNGPWGLIADLAYSSLSAGGNTAGAAFGRADAELKSAILTTVVAYRVHESERHSLDVAAGARWWWSQVDLDLSAGLLPAASESEEEYWVDPVIGGRFRFDLGRGFGLSTYADIGGFGVGSDLTWQVYGGISYAFNDAISAAAGWRHLSVDYDDDGYLYDVDYTGPIIGVTFRF